jgi:hypothetical protein
MKCEKAMYIDISKLPLLHCFISLNKQSEVPDQLYNKEIYLGARGNFVYSYVWFVFSTPLQEHERPM